MIILPAIDIYEGKCVRLEKGDFNKVTKYGDDPIEMAKMWEEKGAKALHVVDLSGAKTGKYSLKILEKLVSAITIPVEIGGGLRNEDRIKPLVEIGVDKAIIGTLAVEDFNEVVKIEKKFPGKIAISLDALNGYVATHGWQKKTDIGILEMAKKMEEANILRLICTDISRDGMLKGPNFETYEMLKKETKLEIIASGGVTRKEDLEELSRIDVYGAIIGKAFYEGVLPWEDVKPWI
ncbi:MAG: 1-(5-phosphoribosyl)-5-[(5-phosphoribosylamino)methylideneamino]imidazole-4-carboxamide isomerase [Tissierellia bacterium]|nr:1-(5-phosphoribosyl)-5-[(5-phosphoribosylamino)methylideneamino]imidazole-4-carboxamide isomerase [Tissierellia bacterium]